MVSGDQTQLEIAATFTVSLTVSLGKHLIPLSKTLLYPHCPTLVSKRAFQRNLTAEFLPSKSNQTKEYLHIRAQAYNLIGKENSVPSISYIVM